MKLSSFLQGRFHVFLYQKLSWEFCFYYLILLGKIYYLINRNEKEKIIKAIEYVFSTIKTSQDIKYITKKVFLGIITHYHEKIFNAFSSVEELKDFLRNNIKNNNMLAIEKGLAKKRGVLLITGHFGGVEFIPAFLAVNDYPVTIIVKFSSMYLKVVSTQKAGRFKTKIIDATSTPNIIKEILNNLKENRIVITQCDEIDEWRPIKNNYIYFLGKNTCLDKTINILLKRGNTTIIFGIMRRIHRKKYIFRSQSLNTIKRHNMYGNEIPASAISLKYLEQYIYRFPEEWYQWKKYPEIQTASKNAIKAKSPHSFSFLPTSISKGYNRRLNFVDSSR
jgi:lauroyl/myristoyl acyltransferase